MMERTDYLNAVAAELRGLTSAERAAVRGELAAHIEDHAEALRALGYTEGEAEAQATEQMGDPVETGRDIAKLYCPFWLWVERVAAVLIAVMILHLLLGFGALSYMWVSLRARICAPDDEAAIQLNERMAVGDDVVRLYGVSGYCPGENCEVQLWLSAYDRSLFGVVQQNIFTYIEIGTGTKEYKSAYMLGGTGWGGAGAYYFDTRVPLAPEDTSVTLRYKRFGETAELTIDLTEVLP